MASMSTQGTTWTALRSWSVCLQVRTSRSLCPADRFQHVWKPSLACRSLLEGFAAFDRVSDLRRRVDELPPELEDLFQHMLGKIEGRYQSQAAKLLRICHQSHLVPGAETIVSLGLTLVGDCDTELGRVPLFQSISNKEKRANCTLLEGQLRS